MSSFSFHFLFIYFRVVIQWFSLMSVTFEGGFYRVSNTSEILSLWKQLPLVVLVIDDWDSAMTHCNCKPAVILRKQSLSTVYKDVVLCSDLLVNPSFVSYKQSNSLTAFFKLEYFAFSWQLTQGEVKRRDKKAGSLSRKCFNKDHILCVCDM